MPSTVRTANSSDSVTAPSNSRLTPISLQAARLRLQPTSRVENSSMATSGSIRYTPTTPSTIQRVSERIRKRRLPADLILGVAAIMSSTSPCAAAATRASS